MPAEDLLGRDLQGKIPLTGQKWGEKTKHHQTPMQVNSRGVKREEMATDVLDGSIVLKKFC